MLKIIYGDIVECDNFIYNPESYFNRFRENEWLTDSFAVKVIKDIDNSTVINSSIIESEVLGIIPPQYLSGGVKTLIMIYNRPDLIFNATWCGENCAQTLLDIGKDKDIIINLEYNMAFPESNQEVLILNSGDTVYNTGDLELEGARYIDKNVSYRGGEVINEG